MRDNKEKKYSILIVDDEPEIRSLLTMALRNAGYSCASAPDGPSAIEMARKNRYDVVFIDLLMPGLSGHETIARLKSISPDTAVGVISIVGDEESMRELFDAGVMVYIRKPFAMGEVLNTVENLLRRKRAFRNPPK